MTLNNIFIPNTCAVMKKFIVIISILSVYLISCGKKSVPPSFSYGNYDWGNSEDSLNSLKTPDTYLDEPMGDYGVRDQHFPQQIYEIWSYSPQTIYIPEQTSIGQAISNTFPNMRRCYDFDNLGGIKLIGEMSADRAGYNYSYYSYPITLSILSLSQLHLGFISTSDNVVCQVLKKNVTIESATLTNSMGMALEILIHNLSDEYQNIAIAQGQMIEVSEYNVQNVVVASHSTTQIIPNGTLCCRIPVFCAAHHRSSPSGCLAKLTPYVMIAPSSTFRSQQRVWETLESNDDPNSYITFYAWGKGAQTRRGRSLMGHAFLRIPNVGVWGFSSKHGMILDDDGEITNHVNNIQYATDSCRIKLSEQDMRALINKLNELRRDVPKYRVGRYDCTSFVMDLADAAKIHYGNRILIQSPMGFMQELKKNNYMD